MSDNAFTIIIAPIVFFFIIVPLVVALISTLKDHSKRIEALEVRDKKESELLKEIKLLKAENEKLETQLTKEFRSDE